MYVAVIVEVICFVIALVCLVNDSSLAWRGMALFMLLTCITEITGLLMKMAHHHNQWVYNIFLVFEAGFTSLMFARLLSKYINSKPLILSGLAVWLLLYVYDVHQHSFFVFNDLTETVMSVVFVIYSFYYYFLLIKDDEYVSLAHNPSFWWVCGALFFYFGSTVSNLFYPFLNDAKIAGYNIINFIFTALIIIMYSCWSYAFICKKWLTTKSRA